MRVLLKIVSSLLATLAAGQAINEKSINDFLCGRGVFSSPEISINAGRDFISREFGRSRLCADVGLRVGSLLEQKHAYSPAIAAYASGLPASKITAHQRLRILLRIAHLKEISNDPIGAKDAFLIAKTHFVHSDRKTQAHFAGWKSKLELKASDNPVTARFASQVVVSVQNGNSGESLVSQVSQVFEKVQGDFDKLLFDKICDRFIHGNSQSDAHLLKTAFSHYHAFVNNYPSVAPFGKWANDVQYRLQLEPQNEDSLYLWTAWSQALQDQDKSAAIAFTSQRVRQLDIAALTPSEKDDAINLVHELEGLTESTDDKNRDLCKQRLKQLNAKSIRH